MTTYTHMTEGEGVITYVVLKKVLMTTQSSRKVNYEVI